MKMTAKQIIDRLGQIRAKVSPLQTEEEELKLQLVAMADGNTAWDATKYRGTVSFCSEMRYDVKRLEKFLTPAQKIRCKKRIRKTVVRITGLKSKR
jgi:hypothetical protein